MSESTTVDKLLVFDEDDETTLADLPDPASLDDQTLALWHLEVTVFCLSVTDAVRDDETASARYDEWEKALIAELERRFPGGQSPTVPAGEEAAEAKAKAAADAAAKARGFKLHLVPR